MSAREWKMIAVDQRKIAEKYLGEIPVKLGAMAKELGIQVKLSSLPANHSGMIHKIDGIYEIKINRHESRQRQRFTLAHEISHFLLHRHIIDQSNVGIQDDILYRSGESQAVEFQANRLAADLVMPRMIVNEKIEHYNGPISEAFIEFLASEFEVSSVAMEVRLSA